MSFARLNAAVDTLTSSALTGTPAHRWPIVVLAELESEAKGSPFRLVAENEAVPDWQAPLAGRVLHYWPWPYGEQAKDVGLDAAAAASSQFTSIGSIYRTAMERSNSMQFPLRISPRVSKGRAPKTCRWRFMLGIATSMQSMN